MKFKHKFLFGVSVWMLMAWIALLVCDYDFVEAVHWSERNQVLATYYLLSFVKALIFGYCLALYTRREVAKILIFNVLCMMICYYVAFYAYWDLYPVAKNEEQHWYKAFLVSNHSSQAIRVFHNVFIGVFSIVSLGILCARIFAQRREKMSAANSGCPL